MSAPLHTTTLRNLRNTRDLRAGILTLAAELVMASDAEGRMTLVDPAIKETTIRQEWDALLPAIAPEVRARMTLAIDGAVAPTDKASHVHESALLGLDKPNYRFEVLRLLLGASLERDSPQPWHGIAASIKGTQIGLIDALGASATPVRGALAALRDAGVVRSLRRLGITPETLSLEQLSRLGAAPQTLRYRFERGARIKPPAELVARALALLGHAGPDAWHRFSLSGTPVAQQDAPGLDLIGTPRLDLVAHVPRGDKVFDADVLRLLDDALEPEPNVLAPAPVVVTLVRAGTRFDRAAGIDHARFAHPCDVFLSLLDMGLRDQAIQYAKAIQS